MDPADMERLLREHSALEHRFEWAATMQTMTDDCYQDWVSLGLRCQGQEPVLRFYEDLFSAFPELSAPRLPDSEGTAYGLDRLWGRGMLTGTMQGPWFGYESTGRTVRTPIFYVMEFRGKLLVGETHFFDAAQFCRQLDLPLTGLLDAVSRSPY